MLNIKIDLEVYKNDLDKFIRRSIIIENKSDKYLENYKTAFTLYKQINEYIEEDDILFTFNFNRTNLSFKEHKKIIENLYNETNEVYFRQHPDYMNKAVTEKEFVEEMEQYYPNFRNTSY